MGESTKPLARGAVIRRGPVLCECGKVVTRSVAEFKRSGKPSFFLVIRADHADGSGANCPGPALNAQEVGRV